MGTARGKVEQEGTVVRKNRCRNLEGEGSPPQRHGRMALDLVSPTVVHHRVDVWQKRCVARTRRQSLHRSLHQCLVSVLKLIVNMLIVAIIHISVALH